MNTMMVFLLPFALGQICPIYITHSQVINLYRITIDADYGSARISECNQIFGKLRFYGETEDGIDIPLLLSFNNSCVGEKMEPFLKNNQEFNFRDISLEISHGTINKDNYFVTFANLKKIYYTSNDEFGQLETNKEIVLHYHVKDELLDLENVSYFPELNCSNVPRDPILFDFDKCDDCPITGQIEVLNDATFALVGSEFKSTADSQGYHIRFSYGEDRHSNAIYAMKNCNLYGRERNGGSYEVFKLTHDYSLDNFTHVELVDSDIRTFWPLKTNIPMVLEASRGKASGIKLCNGEKSTRNPCKGVDCSLEKWNSHCEVQGDDTVCVCDEGWNGHNCNQRGSNEKETEEKTFSGYEKIDFEEKTDLEEKEVEKESSSMSKTEKGAMWAGIAIAVVLVIAIVSYATFRCRFKD